MKKKTGTLIALIILSQLVSLPLFASEARGEARVTITFAAGGVACGAYFFLRFVFRSSLTIEPFEDRTALFNYGPEGWQIQIPTLNFSKDEHRGRTFPTGSPETYQMNLLQFRY